MPIVNKGKDHGPVCDMMREAFGHRAAWLYLLLDEAKKRGHDVEEFASQKRNSFKRRKSRNNRKCF